MNNFFRRMSQLGLPPLTMRRMWVCYRHAWPAAINRCQSLAAIYQWCDPRQSSTYIYIYWSLSLCINLYQLSSNYSPLFTNHSKYIQVFFLSSILHMQCTSWLWYSYIVIILYSWPVPGVLGYYNSCILNNLPFTSLLLHVFFLGGGGCFIIATHKYMDYFIFIWLIMFGVGSELANLMYPIAYQWPHVHILFTIMDQCPFI